MNTLKTIRRLGLTASAVALMAVGMAQPAFSQDQQLHQSLSISLKDAVSTGVATNPEYGAVAASRRATDEELEQGRALFRPSIDLNADTGVEYTENNFTRNRVGESDDETLFRYETGATLTQLLFDGYNAKYEVERQKARVTSSAHRVRETSELVGLAVVESYLEVMRQRQLLVIARQNVADHISILDQIQDGVSAGRSTTADLEQAKARLASARATETDTREALRRSEATYRQEVGDEPGQLSMPEIPYSVLASDVNAEVEQVLAYSPTLDVFEADIDRAHAEAIQTRSSFYPQVDLRLNARHGDNQNGIEQDTTNASALVVMDWNVYRGGADMARSREFLHRHQQSKEERTERARSVENDVRQTWAGMVAAGERARHFAAQAEANTEVVKAYKDQFSLDRRTLLDVLDAQNELFVSRSNTINAEFLEVFAVYRILALKGALFPTLGLEYPRETKVAEKNLWNYEQKMEAR